MPFLSTHLRLDGGPEALLGGLARGGWLPRATVVEGSRVLRRCESHDAEPG
jgi:hypothetical protein